MKLSVALKKVDPFSRKKIENVLANVIRRRIEPCLTGIGAAHSEISAFITKRGERADVYAIKLRMHVPPKTILVSEGRSEELKNAIDTAVNSLRDKVTGHIERVRHQGSFKRQARRSRLKKLKAHQDTLPVKAVNDATAIIDVLLPKFKGVVKRELAFLHSQGDLPPDYPTSQDVVDEVVAAVIADWKPGMDKQTAYLRLLHEMHSVFDKEVRASRTMGDMVSLETPAPIDPRDQAENMVGEEFYEFWQPDELLRIEDVIANDKSEIPEANLQNDQMVGYILRLLKELPTAWRRTLLLRDLEKIPEKELTKLLDVDAATISARIRQADHFIRAKMAEAGLEAPDGGLLSDLEVRDNAQSMIEI